MGGGGQSAARGDTAHLRRGDGAPEAAAVGMNFDDLVARERIEIELDDGDRRLPDRDVGVLARVVRESRVLVALTLCSNRIALGDGALADALARNRTLRTLNLYNNRIGVGGCRGLAAALKANGTLRQLHLGWNNIGDKAVRMLADSLAVNRGLRKVWLNGNNFSDKGANKLAAALARNKYGPKELILEENHISSDAKKTIKSIHASMVQRWDERHEARRRKREIIASKDRVIAKKDEALASKDEEIASLKKVLKQLKRRLDDQSTPNSSKDNGISTSEAPGLDNEKVYRASKRHRMGTDSDVTPFHHNGKITAP